MRSLLIFALLILFGLLNTGNEMGGTCGTYKGEMSCMHGFDGEV